MANTRQGAPLPPRIFIGIAYTVDLDLEGGDRVRFAGFSYARLGTPEALALATTIGEWLSVPVTEENLRPAA